MKPDSLEQQLQRQPTRRIPAEWRGEILAAARAAAADSLRPRPAFSWTLVMQRLQVLLWPRPSAWATLAALWLVVIGFQLAGTDNSSAERARRIPAAEIAVAYKEREQVLTELLGKTDPVPAKPLSRTAAPPPRTERRNAFFQA